jgi:hypothetical protein
MGLDFAKLIILGGWLLGMTLLISYLWQRSRP